MVRKVSRAVISFTLELGSVPRSEACRTPQWAIAAQSLDRENVARGYSVRDNFYFA